MSIDTTRRPVLCLLIRTPWHNPPTLQFCVSTHLELIIVKISRPIYKLIMIKISVCVFKCSSHLLYVINDKQYKRRRTVKHRGHEILTWKTLSGGREKTTGTGQQIFTISGEVTNVGDLQFFLSQDDGLHEVYIDRKS